MGKSITSPKSKKDKVQVKIFTMENVIAPLPEIMTPAAVMELLDVCRTTLNRMQMRGDFPYYKFGKRVYFKRSEIIAAMTANRVEVRQKKASQAA